jgi:hypothetical protein
MKMKKIDDDPVLRDKLRAKLKGSHDVKPRFFGVGFVLKTMLCRRCLKNDEIEKSKVFIFSKKFVFERLDILAYLENMKTLRIIQSVIFNPHQVLAFDFLKHPNLYDEDERSRLNLELDVDITQNAYKLVKYYQTNLEKENSYDMKLYGLLDPKLKEHI